MRTDFLVASSADPEGERFIIFRPDDEIPAGFFFASSLEARLQALNVTLLTEENFRLELTGMGLSSDEVDHHLQRARKARPFEGLTWERTTEIGFRNVHRQEVTRKTELAGDVAYQRVYVMQCGDCGHQYGSHGCDVHTRRCPRCQNGSPGLPTTYFFE